MENIVHNMSTIKLKRSISIACLDPKYICRRQVPPNAPLTLNHHLHYVYTFKINYVPMWKKLFRTKLCSFLTFAYNIQMPCSLVRWKLLSSANKENQWKFDQSNNTVTMHRSKKWRFGGWGTHLLLLLPSSGFTAIIRIILDNSKFKIPIPTNLKYNTTHSVTSAHNSTTHSSHNSPSQIETDRRKLDGRIRGIYCKTTHVVCFHFHWLSYRTF